MKHSAVRVNVEVGAGFQQESPLGRGACCGRLAFVANRKSGSQTHSLMARAVGGASIST